MGFPRLKNFLLNNTRGMKYIVNSDGHSRPCSVFPKLERLQLYCLRMLEKICYGKLVEESFGKLSVLNVEHCGRLKNVVQLSIAKRLEDITVSVCSMIKEIVFQSEDENEGQLIPEVEFPRLRTLDLWDLPELVQFFWSHLETGTSVSSMLDCPLFSEKVVFPSLINLNLAQLNIKKLWPDQLPTTSPSMQNLEKLNVYECHSLEYLLSSTMAKGFSQLQYLHVSDCRAIEEIIATKELVEESKMENISFHLPKDVELVNLPKLRIFNSSGTSMKYPSLLMLTIRNCPKLITLLDTNSTKKDEQEGMSSVTTQPLFQEKRCGTLLPSSISFENLTTLKVSTCPRVINLLASSTARGLVHLSTMSIIKCEQLTEIVTMSEEDETAGEIVFRKLRSLVLDNLPSLRRFYSGNTTITFPELEKLILCQCPKLRSFSCGTINSSKLKSIITQLDDDLLLPRQYLEEYEKVIPKELVWEGDINTTVLKHWENETITYIRHLFMETESI